jgi:glycerol-3-phosphate dehydrogenase
MFRFTREESIARIRRGLDVLIVGGGINGAGIARDLVMRKPSLEIGLADAAHFSSGTSGKNSQMIHGGLRYLENLEFDLVREALLERDTLMRIAPHLVQPLPLMIPFYGVSRRVYYGAGLALYDFLAGKRNIGRRRFLSRPEALTLEPDLDARGLTCAAIYYDCLVHSARFVLANLFDASRRGAAVANYLLIRSWRSEPAGGFTVEYEDRLSGQSFSGSAARIVDARGPWEGGAGLRLVRGSHIVVPRLTRSPNAIAHFNPDGRILFVIPWGSRADLNLIGTTDVDHTGTPDDVRISPDEIAYLRTAVKNLFPSASVEPLAAYASLRPLVASGRKSATKTSRSHQITFDLQGVLKIRGGKYTTYRVMSAEAVDLLLPDFAGRSTTASVPLAPGAQPSGSAVPVPGLGPDEAAAIGHAVRHEMAQRLADVFFVSTYWGHERSWTFEALRPYAEFMGGLAGWDRNRIALEIERVLTVARLPEAAPPSPQE